MNAAGGAAMMPTRRPKILWQSLLMGAALWAFAAAPAFAQLDRVVAEAVQGDIDCLPCAVTIELYLKKVAGVDKVAVSMSKQMVAITFHDGAQFKPKEYRDAIMMAEVRVATFHVSMRGQVEQQGDQLYFVAGPNRFLIAHPPKDLPVGTSLGVMATVDDSTDPFSITSLDDVKPL
jgi:copper chaperone CopZ